MEWEMGDMQFIVVDVDIAFHGIAFPVASLANVQWERGMSCGTSYWTWTLNLVNLQFDALFWHTSYATRVYSLWHHIGHKIF